MLFQEGALFDSMTVYENVAFPLIYHKSPPGRRSTGGSSRTWTSSGLRENAHAMPQELSGGMKRKVAVARAMILEPRYLLYDEPTAGLDPASAAVVESMIRRLQRERSITSLVVTHDIDLTRYIADRIALMEDGRISAHAGRDDAFAEPSRDLRAFHREQRKDPGRKMAVRANRIVTGHRHRRRSPSRHRSCCTC